MKLTFLKSEKNDKFNFVIDGDSLQIFDKDNQLQGSARFPSHSDFSNNKQAVVFTDFGMFDDVDVKTNGVTRIAHAIHLTQGQTIIEISAGYIGKGDEMNIRVNFYKAM